MKRVRRPYRPPVTLFRRASMATFRAGYALVLVFVQAVVAMSADRHDHADLWDIYFVGAQGWAVGDHGIIWHTTDSGATWQPQKSPRVAELRDVHFHDDANGWIVGFTVDRIGQAHGTLFVTSDGGAQWHDQPVPLWPAMYGIAMVNTRDGWAWGAACAGFPSGVFTTNNGGTSWSPAVGTTAGAWSAGSLDGQHRLMLAGRGNRLARVRNRQLSPAYANGYPPTHGVDNRAHVLLIHPEARPLESLVARDFGCVERLTDEERHSTILDPNWNILAGAQVGSDVLLAGSPGTHIRRSRDFGRTWSVTATGWTLPIRAISFSTDNVGCFVSPLGNILRTVDGGRTWSRVQGTHDRVALLAYVPTAEQIPWELLADAIEDGYLARVLVWSRPRVEFDAAETALHAACQMVGTTGGELGERWIVPAGPHLWSTGSVRDHFDSRAPNRIEDDLAATLAQSIQIWRPSVVITVGATPPSTTIETLTHQTVLRGRDAASQSAVTDVLPSWNVTEVWASCARDDRWGTLRVSPEQLRPTQEDTIGTATDGARQLIHRASLSTTRQPRDRSILCARRIVPPAAAQGPRRWLTVGDLPRGTPGRLAVVENPMGLAQHAHQRVTAIRNAHAMLTKLVARADSSKGDEPRIESASWDRVIQATSPLASQDSGPFLYRLGTEYYRQGASSPAVETMRGIVQTGDNHGYALPAVEWLWRWETSQEAQWLRNKETSAVLQPARDLRDKNHKEFMSPTDLLRIARQRSWTWGTEPQTLLSHRAWLRSNPTATMRGLPSLETTDLPVDSPWRVILSAERWLEDRRGASPIPSYTLYRAPQRPHLDGQLHDDCWVDATSMSLMSTSHTEPMSASQLLLSGDAEFLYLAARCPRSAGFEYPPASRDRTRDPDLSDSDRLEILLDINRDYGSAWQLVLDHRGWTGESLMDNRGWNPTWYVAAGGDEDAWSVEAAIAWKELVGPEPPSGTCWVVSATRVVPGRQVQINEIKTPTGSDTIDWNFLLFP